MSDILFKDKSCFLRDVFFFNFYNYYIWIKENPQAKIPQNFQKQIFVNLWPGIVGNSLVSNFLH